MDGPAFIYGFDSGSQTTFVPGSPQGLADKIGLDISASRVVAEEIPIPLLDGLGNAGWLLRTTTVRSSEKSGQVKITWTFARRK